MAVEKSVVRSVRFSPDEWGRVEGWARDAQVSPSRYVREATMRRRPVEKPRGVRAEAVRELSAVGRNLNQLVRLAHRARADRAAGAGADPALGGPDGTVTPGEVEAVLANVLAALDRVSPPRERDTVPVASDMDRAREGRARAERDKSPAPGWAGP